MRTFRWHGSVITEMDLVEMAGLDSMALKDGQRRIRFTYRQLCTQRPPKTSTLPMTATQTPVIFPLPPVPKHK
jgi:hypothetical protein